MSKQQELLERIQAEFQPHFATVENESHMHSSGRGADSHFKLVIVSDAFEGMRKVQRSPKLYQLFADDLKNGIHALALHLYTKSEWESLGEAFQNHQIVLVLDSKYFLTFPIFDFHEKREGDKSSLFLLILMEIYFAPDKYLFKSSQIFHKSTG